MKTLHAVLLIALSTALSGCAALNDMFGEHSYRSGSSSSLVDFLYPDGKQPPPVEQHIPNLQLPLRVGLAFVPANNSSAVGLSEAHKQLLLEKVRASFASRKYIRDIQIIPDTYIRRGGGFTNVEQIAHLYGLDVMALVSYDQVAFMKENALSLTYWTIIGAYIVHGNEHEVQTFVDTAVFDVASHNLLMRAPGFHTGHGKSALVDSPDAVRLSREAGFDAAMENMIGNLDTELTRFESRVKEGSADVKISHRNGGGGAFGLLEVLLVIGAITVMRRQNR